MSCQTPILLMHYFNNEQWMKCAWYVYACLLDRIHQGKNRMRLIVPGRQVSGFSQTGYCQVLEIRSTHLTSIWGQLFLFNNFKTLRTVWLNFECWNPGPEESCSLEDTCGVVVWLTRLNTTYVFAYIFNASININQTDEGECWV